MRHGKHLAAADSPNAACTCGWTATAPSRTQAKILVSDHVHARRAAQSRRRRTRNRQRAEAAR